MLGPQIPASLDDCETFAGVLKELREDRGIKQQALAKRLNVTKSVVSRWETDDLPYYFQLRDVEQIARILGCSDMEFARLVEAFTCDLLRRGGF